MIPPFDNRIWSSIAQRKPGVLALTKELVQGSRLNPPCQILDIGCGAGESLAWLSSLGYIVTGVDIDEDLLKQARIRLPSSTFFASKAESLPFSPNSFPLIIVECTLSLCNQADALKEAYRVLTPKGQLLISDIYQTTTKSSLEQEWADAGFYAVSFTDQRERYVEFVLQGLWQEIPLKELVPCYLKGVPPAERSYYTAILQKR